jgi:hypothetical protein
VPTKSARMRLRRASLSVVVLALAGCTSSPSGRPTAAAMPTRSSAERSTSQPGSRSPSPAGANSALDGSVAVPSGTPRCTTIQLQLVADVMRVSEPTDDSTHIMGVQNRSGTSCYVRGRPSVVLYSSTSRVTARFGAHSTQVLHQVHEKRVLLRPRHVAYFGIGGPHADCNHAIVVTALSASVPPSTTTLAPVRVSYPLISVCRDLREPGSYPLAVTALAAHPNVLFR